MRLTLLGTGTSMGVPQIGCDCAVCHSDDPHDRRTRTAALIEDGEHTILIDTPPELRLQLLRAGTKRIDAVLYTHEHADHVHGIDDLRSFSLLQHEPLPLYAPPETARHLRHAFNYIFDAGVVPVRGTSKPSLTMQPLTADREHEIGGLAVRPIAFRHGNSEVFGYRIGPMAYVTDVKSVSASDRDLLRGVRVLVLNALWWREHPTHLSIPEAIAIAQDLGVERTYLTHLTHETAHRDLLHRLPPGIEPGYDGMKIEI